jgi:membrane-bound lytic murein transglycosylase D
MKMKNLIFSLILTLIVGHTMAQTQLTIPTAPNKVEFANVMINLNSDAQKKVNTEINNLLTPPNKFLDQKLERMQLYFPIIEKVLEEENTPEDLKYLSVMESSLLPEAISSSNAVGYWQFKEATAKEVGLRIDNNQDERKNIYFATKAAASYLKKNNLTLKNWISSILSFNVGLEGSKKEISEAWTNASEIDFNSDTHDYLIKALAYRIAFEHRLNRLKDGNKKFIEYPGNNKSLAEIAVELSTDLNELRRYNSWLHGPSIQNDKKYSVLILTGSDQAGELESKVKKRADLITGNINFPELKRITEATTSSDAPIFYQINGKKGILSQPGQEAAQMAIKSKTKLKSFLSYNDMTEKDIAKEGQIYYLQKKSNKAKVPFHTLNSSQTLWDVSQMYGVKLACLYKYNRIKKTERGQAGRVLYMQKTRPKSTPIEYIKEVIQTKPAEPVISKTEPKKEVIEPKPTKVIDSEPMTSSDPIFDPKAKDVKPKEIITYPKSKAIPEESTVHTVKPGETVFSIAKMYGITGNELRTLNDMTASEGIRENQKLIVSREKPSSRPVSEPEIIRATEKPAVKTKEIVTEPKVDVVTKPKPVIQPTETYSNNDNSGYHVVAKGETAYSISKRYNLTVSQLLAMNGMKTATLEIGQALKVAKTPSSPRPTPAVVIKEEPVESTPIIKATPAAPKVTTAPKTTGLKYHTVAAGETLYSISKKYGVSTDQVKSWNKLSDNNVKLGSSLIVSK